MTSPVHHGGSGRRTTPFLSARSPVFGVRLAADDQPENAGRASAILGHGGFARVSGTAAAYQQTGHRTALKFFGAFRALRALTLLNSSQEPGSGFTKRLGTSLLRRLHGGECNKGASPCLTKDFPKPETEFPRMK